MKIRAGELPPPGETLLETQIPSDLALKTPLALRLVATLIEEGLIAESERAKLEVCFEEALKNAIVHGNRQDPRCQVRVRIFRGAAEWGVTVEDEGDGFGEDVLTPRSDPDFPWLEHGRGIHLMEHIAGGVEYFRGGRSLLLKVPLASGAERGPSAAGAAAGRTAPGGASPEPLEIAEEQRTLIARLHLPDVSEEQVDPIFVKLQDRLRSSPPALLILDLGAAAYFSSHAIGRLVALLKTCQRLGHTLRLVAPSGELRKAFAAMRLDHILPLHESVPEALAQAFSSAGPRSGSSPCRA
jgi:serine/threonine-protein kinase RsbW